MSKNKKQKEQSKIIQHSNHFQILEIASKHFNFRKLSNLKDSTNHNEPNLYQNMKIKKIEKHKII